MHLHLERLPVWLELSQVMLLEVIWDCWGPSMIWEQDTWHWHTHATHLGNYYKKYARFFLLASTIYNLGLMLPKPRQVLSLFGMMAFLNLANLLSRKWIDWECSLTWHMCRKQQWMTPWMLQEHLWFSPILQPGLSQTTKEMFQMMSS